MTVETQEATPAPGARAAWGGVLAMSLCVFVLIASEFMPVSLLTPIAADLAITEGRAGQAIAVSGIFAMLTSLSISHLAGGVDRRTVLLALTGLMLISGIIVAAAPDGAVLMVGRALLGMVIGGFWSMTTAVVMRLVPDHAVPRALALLNGGNALATTIAAPLGSFLGAVIGWRGAFFCIVPLAAVAFVWQAWSLPRMPGGRRSHSKSPFRLLQRRPVALGMAAVLFQFMGQFALFTYLRPFLEAVTRVDVETLSVLLLVIGISGLIGTSLIGMVLARSLGAALIGMPLVLGGIALALAVAGDRLWIVAPLLGLWGLVGTAAPVGWWTWLACTLPEDAEAGGGLMVAIIQAGITVGAAAGGVLFDAGGHAATFILAAALLGIAAVLAMRAAAGRAH